MRRLASLSLGALALVVAAPISAQTVPVAGLVADAESGDPIAGVAVRLVGPDGTVGPVQTNAAGQFQLSVAPGTWTLVAGRLAYQDLSLPVVVPGEGVSGLRIELASRRLLLNDIVVTVSGGRPERQLDAPGGTHTIGRDEIAEQPAPNIGDRLTGLAGLDVAKTGVSQSNIVTRGFNNVFSGAMLVLVDNRIARVPSIRLNAYNMIPSTEQDIERMEVVLGPGAALYGPNSASGVLHFFTASPIDRQGTEVAVTGGERSLFQGSFRTAHRLGDRWGFKVSGNYARARDWIVVDSFEVAARAEDPEIPVRDPEQERWSIDTRLDWRPWEDGAVTLAAGRNLLGSSIELTGGGAGQALDWAYTYAQLRLNRGRLFSQVFLNGSDAGDTFLLRTGQPLVDRSRTIVGQLQHGFGLLDERLDLIYGLDYEYVEPRTGGTITGRNEADDEITQIGGYVHGRYALTGSLDFVGALRVDRHDRLAEGENVNYSPRAALVWDRSETSSFRFTWNRAFGPPGTNNLFLDLVAARVPIAPGLAYNVRIRGVPEDGFIFTAACPGGIDDLCMRSPLAPGQALPASAVPFWDAVVQAAVPAPFRAALMSPGAAPGDPALASRLLWFSQEDAAAGRLDQAFQPDLGELRNIDPITSTITSVYEVGYRGIHLEDWLSLAANVYFTDVENFIGPLRVETPTVHFDLGATNDFVRHRLAAAIQGGLITEAQVQQLVGMIALAPLGTVVPDGDESSDLALTYRNFGQVDFWGSDLQLTYQVSNRLRLGGSYSWVSDDCFAFSAATDCSSSEDVALNAPKNKGSLSFEWDDELRGVSLGSSLRFNAGFPMNSGVYVGEVEGYTVVDANVEYRLPWAPAARVTLSAYNLLDNRHREFVGAPALGRLLLTRFSYSF